MRDARTQAAGEIATTVHCSLFTVHCSLFTLAELTDTLTRPAQRASGRLGPPAASGSAAPSRPGCDRASPGRTVRSRADRSQPAGQQAGRSAGTAGPVGPDAGNAQSDAWRVRGFVGRSRANDRRRHGQPDGGIPRAGGRSKPLDASLPRPDTRPWRPSRIGKRPQRPQRPVSGVGPRGGSQSVRHHRPSPAAQAGSTAARDRIKPSASLLLRVPAGPPTIQTPLDT